MVTVQCIAAAAEIIIFSVRRKHIIYIIVKSFKRYERTILISLRRVVEHHIQDHFDIIVMKFPDQVFKLCTLSVKFFLRAVACIRRKKTHRIVTPVVQKFLSIDIPGIPRLVKFKYRHQFHSIDAQILQIGNLFPDPVKGTRMFYI